MLIYDNNYINIPILIANLTILTVAGILLFTNLKIRNAWIIIDIEFFVSLIENFYLRYPAIVFFLIMIPLRIPLLAAQLLTMVLLSIVFLISRLHEKVPEFSLVYLLISSFLFSAFSPLGTDEEMIDYYSAHVFLSGMNPYVPSNTASVYSYFNASQLLGTPLTTGGVVTRLGYPSLAFLLQVPSNIFHFNPNYVNTLFYFAFIVMTYMTLRGRGEREIFPFLAFPLLINANFLYFPEGGVPDIIWIFFTFLSLRAQRTSWKGIFYGIALAVKQIPLLLLPFYLYYLKREGYSLAKFATFTVLAFMIFNLYFIIQSPLDYFSALISPEVSNLLIVSDAFSSLTVGDVFFLPKLFFDVAMSIIFLGEFYLFVKEYDFFRESWVAFPYFLFLFNYRSLWNYLIYWPLLLFGIGKKMTNADQLRRDADFKGIYKVVGAVALSLFLSAMVFHYVFLPYSNSLKIEVIKVGESEGLVEYVLANVSFSGDPNGESSVRPLFRILPYDGCSSVNGILWKSNSTFLNYGKWEIVNVTPYSAFQAFHVQEFEVDAYYGSLSGYVIVNPSS